MNKKALNQNMNYVTANLVATYDLCALSDPSVKYIDYLCVYEYEYEGKIYKYREHKKDNFSPIPETLELVFRENPSDVHKVKKTPSENNDSKSTSSHWCVIFLVCFLGLPIILVICAICHLIKFISEVEFSEINILPILNFSFFLIIVLGINLKIIKNSKSKDEIIEDAFLNNRVIIAHLVKSNINSSYFDNSMSDYYRGSLYEGKYKYTYNGKTYTKKFSFSYDPPRELRVFWGKNPKDIIYYTR